MKPLFSVVIPTYNRADKLERAIKSILAQKYTNFEVLVMDDGSTDNTAKMVASLSDARIIYEWDVNFGGPARPRNRGIAIAKGEWVCFLDADDYWTNDKLQACHSLITSRVDLIYHDLEIIRDKPSLFQRRQIKSWQVKPPVLMDLLLKGNAIVNSSVVVRKSLLVKIGGINEDRDMIAAEDYNTWLRISQLTNNFIYLPRRLGYYQEHINNISNKDMSLAWQRSVAEFISLLTDNQTIKLEASFRYTSGRYKYLMGNYIAAKKDFKYSIKNGLILVKIKSLILVVGMYFGFRIF
jgi:glycosyltransferase involved in cell wall biosynthesis